MTPQRGSEKFSGYNIATWRYGDNVEDTLSGSKSPTRVIVVGNQKGGVGKTTNTVHIATALGEMGRRCLGGTSI
jgi:Mrp family chromosome partitioning ATPase